MPFVIAPDRTCPRKLKKGELKRYMGKGGPLMAYMIACPSCGFIEMHMHEVADYVEVDGKLDHANRALPCMLCHRKISIAGGVIMAVSNVVAP